MKVSNCCGALFYEPGWPDNDLCSACKEHSDAIDQEEPSIVVMEMPPMKRATWKLPKIEKAK